MMRKILLLIGILYSFNISAQMQYKPKAEASIVLKEGTVKGFVFDEYTKKAVMYANTAIFNMIDSTVVSGALSDENGYFEIKEIPFGTYYLVVDFIGYDKQEISNVSITSDTKIFDMGNVLLKLASENLEEVQIIGERNFVEYKIDRKVINISKNINASGGTIVDALENAPSIQVDIDGNVSLRGSTNFKVLIDGKPSILEANDILQQIPASSVENIEIITNPSVKYDPDGTTGILNIIMKKNHSTGFNGVVNASIGTGDKYSADFLFNYRTKKANYYFGADWGDRTYSGTGNSFRETYLNDSTNYLETASERNHARQNYTVQGGVDLYVNEKNTVSLSGKYGYFGFGMSSLSNNYEYSNPVESEIYSFSEGLYEVGGYHFSANIDFKHNFNKKGHEVSFAAYFQGRTGGNTTTTIESFTDYSWNQILSEDQYRSFQDRGSDDLTLKVDYSLPINDNVKFEAGYQSRLNDAGGDYTFENLTNNIWIIDDTYSNKMVFTEDIHSVYSTISGKLIGIQYLAGLRGEYFIRTIDQQTTNEVYTIEKFDFFPSLHLTKELQKDQQLQVSYSRRIERPRHWYLNPFPGFSDSYSVRIGNPELLPEYIDSYDLSYQKRIKQSFFNVEAFYRQKNNSIERIQELREDGKILSTFDNLDKEYSYGTEISGNFQLVKWWTLYANVNFYRYNLEGDIAGITTNLKSINYDLRMNTTFMFSKNIRLQLNGFYNAPTVTSQGTREGFYYFGAAYRHELFNKKLSVVLNVRDIFKTGKYVSTAEGIGFYSSEEMFREAPVFTLSLSYKINNYKQKRGERDDNNDFNEGMM